MRVESLELSCGAICILFALGGCGDNPEPLKKTKAPTPIDLIIDAPNRTITHAGSPITIQLKLSQASPSAVDVQLTATPALLEINPAQVRIEPDQWDKPISVSLKAQGPALMDGQAIKVSFAPTTQDLDYPINTPEPLNFTISAQTEAISAVATLTGPAEIRESGERTTIDVTLSAAPLGPVKLPVTISKPAEAESDTSELSFTPDNWDKPQVVTILALDDLSMDGDQPFEVLIGPAASDVVQGASVALTAIDGSCGNMVVDGDEACDDPTSSLSCDYGLSTCQVCDAQCALIEGQVTGFCGDGVIQAEHGESCDGAALEALTCEQFNQRGTIACDAMCAPDLSGCTPTVAQLEGGYAHTCALMSDKSVKCWGRNNNGQLGDGTQLNSPSPKAIPAITDAKALAIGTFFSCALHETDGAVSCWGSNNEGQIGDHTSQGIKLAPTPVQRFVVNMFEAFTGATSIDAGYAHACVINADKKVQCWGDNNYGQLGSDTFMDRSYIAGELLSNVRQIALGAYHSCALLDDGKVYCWGRNDFGQLGLGSINGNKKVPVEVLGLPENVEQLSAGPNQTCAIIQGGDLYCWGNNFNGQLADGTNNDSATPIKINNISGVNTVSVGGLHICATTTAKTLYCWGGNQYAQLGDGTTDERRVPTLVMGLGDVKAVLAGSAHTCTLLDDDKVSCWGLNMYGSLGDGTFETRTTPITPFEL